jgi:hypothetical protein
MSSTGLELGDGKNNGVSAKTEADPPFDFAQGRLCGDDNQKSYGDAIQSFRLELYF